MSGGRHCRMPELPGRQVSDGEMMSIQVNLALRRCSSTPPDEAGLVSTAVRTRARARSRRRAPEWRALLPSGSFICGNQPAGRGRSRGADRSLPDLDFNVSGRRDRSDGKVTVPYREIQPQGLRRRRRGLTDEVIVGSEEEDPTKRWR